MWEEWEKYGESEHGKNYELMVGSDVKVLLVVRLHRLKADPLIWMVDMSAFNPGAGEYIIYQDVFSSLSEAEEEAWEKAQEAVRIRKEPINLRVGRLKPIPDNIQEQRTSSSRRRVRWNGWHNNSDQPRVKKYGFRLEDGSLVSVGLYSPKTRTGKSSWSVIIKTYSPPPSNEPSTIYEGLFPRFEEAETKAWEVVQQLNLN